MKAQNVIDTFTKHNDKYINFIGYKLDDKRAAFLIDGVKIFNGISVEEYDKVIEHFAVFKINGKQYKIKSIQGWILNGKLKTQEVHVDENNT